MTSNDASFHGTTAVLHPDATTSANCPSNKSLLLVLPIKAREDTEQIHRETINKQEVTAPTISGADCLSKRTFANQTRDERDCSAVEERICSVQAKDQHVIAPSSAGGGFLSKPTLNFQSQNRTNSSTSNHCNDFGKQYNGYKQPIDEDDIKPLGGWKPRHTETKQAKVSTTSLTELTNALNEWDTLTTLEYSIPDEVDRGASAQEQSMTQQKRSEPAENWSIPAEFTSKRLNGQTDMIRAQNVSVQESSAPKGGGGGCI